MRILIHDYAGHPFQVQLSRSLAKRGHEVTHAYAAMAETPRGALALRAQDPPTLAITGIGITGTFRKHALVRRRFQELEYGYGLCDLVKRARFDWVVSANTPSEPQALLLDACRRSGVRFATWVQDFYGIAVDHLMRRRLPLLGGVVGAYYKRLDARVLRESDAVVLITGDFRGIAEAAGAPRERLSVIENWAPLDEMPVRQRANRWAERHGLADRFCFLYSGTLGMKHNPGLLVELAKRFRVRDDVRVVVISEGPGEAHLAEQKAAEKLDNLVLLPFQPFEAMPDVLASADVLLALLERDAGVFSVPSKVLTYLCAARPVLASMPPQNLAARTILKAGAGTVVEPDETEWFLRGAETLLHDEAMRNACGRSARAYAERTFDIERITTEFETVLGNAGKTTRAPGPSARPSQSAGLAAAP